MIRDIVYYVTLFLTGAILVAFAYLLYLIVKFFSDIKKGK